MSDDDYTFATPAVDRPAALSRQPMLGDRYEDLGRIGLGGMGEVRRVRDRSLGRIVAMKILTGDPGPVEREARLTARLQHPGIVPVHDFGLLPDGRRWFTMREVRGLTLSERIDAVHAATSDRAWGTTGDGWTLRRLVDALEAVAEVVAYAHSEGVVHCDLKPSNVMIGSFGEVQVLDWGIARAIDAPEAGPVRGTPAYLAPEVVAGSVPESPSDVYALGTTLYRILTGVRPYDSADSSETLTAIRAGPPLAPGTRVSGDHPALPPDLVEACDRAMARNPLERPTAAEFAETLRRWRDGARDRARAQALAESADGERERAGDLRSEAARLRADADALLSGVEPHDPVDRKRPAWSALDRADQLESQAAVAEVRFVEAQRAALELASDLDAAHRRLAAYHRERLAEAEALGRAPDAARHETLLRSHDRGEHAAWLRGDATLDVDSDPRGARVLAERYELEDRRLIPGPARELGQTPLSVTLPHGSWRLRLVAPGCAETVVPVTLDRAGRWDRVPPGGAAPAPVRLLREGELGPDECYVPAGWFFAGGDPEAPDALPERRLWVDGFVLARFPVTHARYLRFLQDALDRGVDLDPLLPRNEARAQPIYEVRHGRVELGAFEGRALDPDEPVVLIDWASAVAYCRWLGAGDGHRWRLPHELEWEKAARGVDRRVFPWGPHLDPTWTRMQRSVPDAPGPARVHDYPDDESPYGVRGLGGNVRDWCGNGYRRHGPDGDRLILDPEDAPEPLRCIRGGSWHSGVLFCRSAGRLVGAPELRRHVFGFRPCRSLDPLGCSRDSGAVSDQPSALSPQAPEGRGSG